MTCVNNFSSRYLAAGSHNTQEETIRPSPSDHIYSKTKIILYFHLPKVIQFDWSKTILLYGDEIWTKVIIVYWTTLITLDHQRVATRLDTPPLADATQI